jgi:hypothetical protein
MYQLGLTLEQNGHKELRNQHKNVKKSFMAEMDDAYRKDYFYQVHNVMMEKQPRNSCSGGVRECRRSRASP